MRIERLKAGPITFLAFRGAFEGQQLAWAREQLGEVLDDGERNLVFNFRRVDAVEPEPLQFLIDFHRDLLARQGRLVISNANPAVRSAILLADPDTPVRFAADDAAATSCFGPAKPPGRIAAGGGAAVGRDDGFRVRLVAKGDHHVLGWRGEIDPSRLASLRSGIETLLERGATHIVLNLSQVRFITSSGIAFIMEVHELLRAWGGRLVISEPSPLVRKTFDVLGLDEAVRIVETDDEAAHYLRKREVPERSAVELTSPHARRLGTGRVEFQLFESPEETAVGRLLFLTEDGLAFAYPSEWGHSSIDASRLTVRCALRLRIPHSVQDGGSAGAGSSEFGFSGSSLSGAGSIDAHGFDTDEGGGSGAAPGLTEPGPAERWRLLEMDAEVQSAREIEDDPIDALMIRVRYTRIDPDDRAYLENLRSEDVGGR